MLKVQVELYGVVRDLVRETRFEVELPSGRESTFRDVFEALIERCGPGLRERIFDHEQSLLSFVKLFAAGAPVHDVDECVLTHCLQRSSEEREIIGTADGGQSPQVRIIVFAAAGGG